MTVRITGDVHGLVEKYVEGVQSSGCEYSLQVGDMGFYYESLENLDFHSHKFIGGNHDNYDYYSSCPHALGDFGSYSLGPLDFYFIRGAFSIDMKARIMHERQTGFVSWWKDEQLGLDNQLLALSSYKASKPRVMITHTCPTEIAKHIGSPGALKAFGFNPDTFATETQVLLQDCFDSYRPDVWIFGHFHRTIDFQYKGTRFICLGELRSIDYRDGQFINNNKLDSVRQI